MSPITSEDLLMCTACGTQFDDTDRLKRTICKICDDPRQFVPSTGQAFTTLKELRLGGYKNLHRQIPGAHLFYEIRTEPQIAIGQRAILIKTPHGNVLWDLIPFLDEETTSWIRSQGGIEAIVISHPHYWSTHMEWAKTFDCKVYLSGADEEWLCRSDELGLRVMIPESSETIEYKILNKQGQETGVLAIRTGGHFPGSLVAFFHQRLLIADTLVTTPSGRGDWKQRPRPKGMNSFVYMWSIPNMIPLPPDEMAKMWEVLKKYDFVSTHGAFISFDVYATDVKQRVLESMKIQVRAEGYQQHNLLLESC